jgi:hypothetical protein
MIPILKRYNDQYGLRQAPLVFIHGVIAAVNTMTALDRYGIKKLDNSYLPDLERALVEMAPTWAIAGQALNRLRGLLSTRNPKSSHSILLCVWIVLSDLVDDCWMSIPITNAE